ncbi:MAG: hypothetical protein ACXVD3_02005 [Nocardioides sp.]
MRYPEDPLQAIDGGPDGLELARDCVTVVHRHLAPAGSAILQLGTTAQVAQLDDLVAASPGLVLTDVREFDRGVLARLDRS